MFVREFGDTALVMRGPERQVLAYLLGFLTPAGVGYIHVVGVSAEGLNIAGLDWDGSSMRRLRPSYATGERSR